MNRETATNMYFKFIESCLLIKEKYKAPLIMDTFFIGRAKASQLIQEYQAAHPGQVVYNRKWGEYRPTEEFKPSYIKKRRAALYLQSLDIVFKDEY